MIIKKRYIDLQESDTLMSFSQYPRCLELGKLQISDCMYSTNGNVCYFYFYHMDKLVEIY